MRLAAGSSNGRTTVSGAVYLGSSPSPAAKSINKAIGVPSPVNLGSSPRFVIVLK